MEDGYLPDEPHCVLCLTCANAGETRCAAGIDPNGTLFACESYVRVFDRGGVGGAPLSRARKRPRSPGP